MYNYPLVNYSKNVIRILVSRNWRLSACLPVCTLEYCMLNVRILLLLAHKSLITCSNERSKQSCGCSVAKRPQLFNKNLRMHPLNFQGLAVSNACHEPIWSLKIHSVCTRLSRFEARWCIYTAIPGTFPQLSFSFSTPVMLSLCYSTLYQAGGSSWPKTQSTNVSAVLNIFQSSYSSSQAVATSLSSGIAQARCSTGLRTFFRGLHLREEFAVEDPEVFSRLRQGLF